MNDIHKKMGFFRELFNKMRCWIDRTAAENKIFHKVTDCAILELENRRR